MQPLFVPLHVCIITFSFSYDTCVRFAIFASFSLTSGFVSLSSHVLISPFDTPLSVQMLIEDFSTSGGYEFLYKYLLMLEERENQEALDAQRNLVLLVSDLVTCGFVQLQPTLSDPGPFNPDFKVPVPAENGLLFAVGGVII